MLYIYDIFDFNLLDPDIKILIYADNIVIYAKNDDPLRTINLLQENVNRIITWLNYWKLSLAPDKCCCNNFSRHRQEVDPIKSQGFELSWQDDFMFLGVYFTKILSLNKQICKDKSAQKSFWISKNLILEQ